MPKRILLLDNPSGRFIEKGRPVANGLRDLAPGDQYEALRHGGGIVQMQVAEVTIENGLVIIRSVGSGGDLA